MAAPAGPLNVRDLERVRLLSYELKQLLVDMRAEKSPWSGRLATIIRRFANAKFDDDR